MSPGPVCPKAPSFATRRHLAAGLVVALGACALSGCGTAHSNGPGAKPGAPEVRASLATSLETSSGSWATVAMGHLDQPLNTFWQLFFRPTGAVSWSDQASALAVATNGGLVVASRARGSLLVGVRPANLLDYSPLIVTSNASSWTPTSPVGPLAAEPDALAIGTGDQAMALVREGGTERVLASPRGLVHWRQMTTQDELATSQAGRACGVGELTAVGYLAGNALIGASCRRDGVVGVFLAHGGTWRLVGPRLPPALSTYGTEVLGLETTNSDLCVLVVAGVRDSTGVVAACTSVHALKWQVSPALPMAGQKGTVSFGPAGQFGLYALTPGTAHHLILAVMSEPTMRWRRLPAPPSGTATVVFGPAGRLDALSVGDTAFTDWVLAGGATWRKMQVLHVAIQFGSSS